MFGSTARASLAYVWPRSLIGDTGNTHKYTCTQARLIQMLSILFYIPGSLSSPILLSKQMRMNGSTWKPALNASCGPSYFHSVVYLWARRKSPVSVFEMCQRRFGPAFKNSGHVSGFGKRSLFFLCHQSHGEKKMNNLSLRFKYRC